MEQSAIISFVSVEALTKVASRDDLLNRIARCRADKTALENLDLSEVELENIDFSRLAISNVVFNAYVVSDKNRKPLFNLNFMGCRISRCSFAFCEFDRCNFDTIRPTGREIAKDSDDEAPSPENEVKTTEIKEADFFYSVFRDCRFRFTQLEIVDFRYCQFRNCSLGDVNVRLGDFYMTSFRGTTNFQDSTFALCSLTFTTFEHEVIRMTSIDRLAQEDYEEYSKVIIGYKTWRKQNPCGKYSHRNESEDEGHDLNSKIECYEEASRVYAQLSAYYTGSGLNHDSNEAYVKAKTNMTRASNCNLRKGKKIWTGIGNLLAYGIYFLMGFGFKLKYVFLDVLVLVVGGGFLWLHYNKDAAEFANSMSYSLVNSLGPFDEFYKIVGAGIAGLHTALGILLVGFLGFILANKIRNNY